MKPRPIPTPATTPKSPQSAALDTSDLDALERDAGAHHQPIPLIVRAIVAVARELRAMRAERG